MNKNLICICGSTAACRYAGTYLKKLCLPLTDQPGPDVGHLLLDVPSFGPEGQLRGGGRLDEILAALPNDVRIYGGNLTHPLLKNYATVDLLQDAAYLAQNAYITAECALDVALPYLTVTLRHCPVLIIGWGRIGKCLGQLLKAIGADVTIAARKENDRAMIQALGYTAVDIYNLPNILNQFRLIYNTAPAPILSTEDTNQCREDCVCIELASTDGIRHENVITARGLPGIHLPESSGILIAETFMRYYQKEV